MNSSLNPRYFQKKLLARFQGDVDHDFVGELLECCSNVVEACVGRRDQLGLGSENPFARHGGVLDLRPQVLHADTKSCQFARNLAHDTRTVLAYQLQLEGAAMIDFN